MKFHEPALTDPLKLQAGDQVACHDAGPRMQLITAGDHDGVHGLDEIWVTLLNKPADTKEVWGEPVPAHSVALHLGDDAGFGWRVMPLPLVRARRRVPA